MLVESRIRGNVYVRFGGECPETYRSNAIRRWTFSLLKETVKIYEQGKQYYDALKSVHNLVKDARKVKETLQLVGDISDIYVDSFQRMMSDSHFTVEELNGIANGYAKLMLEAGKLVADLTEVTKSTGLSMSDKERMEIIDQVYKEVLGFRNLTDYYTKKCISVSYIRAKKTGEYERVQSLYNKDYRYW